MPSPSDRPQTFAIGSRVSGANPGRGPEYALARLFTRRDDGWGPRDSIADHPRIVAAVAAGRIRAHANRIPRIICMAAANACPWLVGGESLDHVRLKWAAEKWMRALGAPDAEAEVATIAGIADVYSKRADWIVECGNTRFGKLRNAVMQTEAPRFTLIPYQALRLPCGATRSLIAIDFVWEPDLTRDLQDDDFARAQKVAALLSLDDPFDEDPRLPLPRITGRA